MNITITSGPEVDLMGWSLLRTRCVWFATWPGSSRGTETASKKCFQTVLTKFWLDYPTTPLKHYLSVHSPSPLPIPVCKGQISSMGWGAVVKLPLHNNGHSPDPFFLCLFVIWRATLTQLWLPDLLLFSSISLFLFSLSSPHSLLYHIIQIY